MKNKKQAYLPEKVPQDMLTPLAKKYLNWKNGMLVIIGILLTFTFLNVLVTNPIITGYAVYEADSEPVTRLSHMTSILIVVFGFFALFIFMITRRMSERN